MSELVLLGGTYSEDLLVSRIEREAAALGHGMRVTRTSTNLEVVLFQSSSSTAYFTQIIQELAARTASICGPAKLPRFGWYQDFVQCRTAVRHPQALHAPALRLQRVQLRECPKHRARTKRRRFIHETRARLRARGAL